MIDDVTSGQLLRPIGDLAVELPDAYWIVLPKNRQPRPAVKTVVQWLKRQAAVGARVL